MNWIPLLILLGVLVILLGLSFFRKKKYNDQIDALQNSLKKGDKVVTYSGIVGKIVEIFEQENTKQVILETGRKDHIGYLQVDMKAVYSTLEALNQQQNPTAKFEEPAKVEETAVEEPVVKAKKTTTTSKSKK